MPSVEPTLVVSMTREMVSGNRGKMIACQWSGKNTQAVSRKWCWSRRSRTTLARSSKSASPKGKRCFRTRQVTKKKRSDKTRRRRRDTTGRISPDRSFHNTQVPQSLWKTRLCATLLAQFTLPKTVHDEARSRAWQRRFYDMNIWSDKKRWEKLNYMHYNPVQRGLVKEPGEWPWSSWRFYFLADESVLGMDRVP